MYIEHTDATEVELKCCSEDKAAVILPGKMTAPEFNT